MISLFRDDAVHTNARGVFRGHEEIRPLFEEVVDQFQVQFSDFDLQGDMVTFSGILTTPSGLTNREEYEALVEEGLIVSFTVTYNPNLSP